MAESDELQDWDLFFYYGETRDLELECRFDLFELLLQNKRSLFYSRRLAAGLDQYENNPNTVKLQVLGKYEIASAVAYRNSLVSDGTTGHPDRRIAVSQNSIGIKQKRDETNIEIFYFLFSDYETPRSNSFELVR
jgi:hypothetical protein